MGLLGRLRASAPRRSDAIPFDMFEISAGMGEREARRARRLESIYHLGQDKIWDGRQVLAELVAKHGRPQLAERERNALSRISR